MFYKRNKFEGPDFEPPSAIDCEVFRMFRSSTNLGELYWLTNLKFQDFPTFQGHAKGCYNSSKYTEPVGVCGNQFC